MSFHVVRADSQPQTTASGTQRPRSTTGCWTCRVRRKKCDERPGKCATCAFLHLKCAGYGARPAWMDGSHREKQKVESLKNQIRRHRRQASDSPRQPHGQQRPHARSFSTPTPASSAHGLDLAPSDGSIANDTIVQSLPGVSRTLPSPTPSAELIGSMFQDGFWLDALAPVADFNSQSHVLAEPSPCLSNSPIDDDNEALNLFGPTIWGDMSSLGLSDLEHPPGHTPGSNPRLEYLAPHELEKSTAASTHRTDLDDLTDMFIGLPGAECSDTCASSPSSIVDRVGLSYFVDNIVPYRFPYMNSELRSSITETILRPHERIRKYLHGSTLAFVKRVQRRGLRRYGLASEQAPSSAAVRYDVASAIQLLTEFVRDPAADHCVDELAVVLGQAALLQVSVVICTCRW